MAVTKPVMANNRIKFRDDDRQGFEFHLLRGNDGDFHLSVVPHLDDITREKRTAEDVALYDVCYGASVRVRMPMQGGGEHEELYHAFAALWNTVEKVSGPPQVPTLDDGDMFG